MAKDFLVFLEKFVGRYGKLVGLNVVGRQLIRPELVVGGLIAILGINFWNQRQLARQKILGARQEIVVAEIREEIARLEPVAEKVNTRDVWLKLAGWYWQIFDEGKAKEYWQKAWWIDPNNEQVTSVRRMVQP